MTIQDQLAQIKAITGAELVEAPVRGDDRLSAVMTNYRDQAKFATDPNRTHIIGLNLENKGLTDKQWADVLQKVPELGNHLQALKLSGNKLTKFEAALPALRLLDVSDNGGLKTLHVAGSWLSLEALNARSCALSDLRLPFPLPKLRVLVLNQNKLGSSDFLQAVPSLEILDLGKNPLKKFSLPGGFKQLKYLFLQGCDLSVFQLTEPLPERMEVLQLTDNQLQELPGRLYLLSHLHSLYLHGNPMSSIPKGDGGVPDGEHKNAAGSVKNYLRSIAEDAASPNDEVKLVLLGNSTAGKSTLRKYLMTGEYNPEDLPSTHGIENDLWTDSGQPFKINIWDFGGQEFYHSTHRLFLSDNSVSLVVFDKETNRQGEVDLKILLYKDGKLEPEVMPIEVFEYTYWLDNIQWFCQGGQVVALVQTKMDLNPDEKVRIDPDKINQYHLPEDTLRISVDAAAKGQHKYQTAFELFKIQLFELLDKAKGKYRISEKWLEIKNELRALPEATKYLSYDEYRLFCENIKPGISALQTGQTETTLDTITKWLHETGTILHFKDPEYPALAQMVFVKPKWVADTIYKVLDYGVMHKDKGGKFDLAHVARAVPDFDNALLLDLMQKFRLIFEVKGQEGTFVAPQYLPAELPEALTIPAKSCRHHQFSLAFPTCLPQSIFTRFICKYGPLSNGLYWKNGIVFNFPKESDCLVFAECIRQEGDLRIRVSANKPEPVDMHDLFKTLEEITDANPDLLLSADGASYALLKALKNPPPSGDVENQTSGGWLNVKDFARILGRETITDMEKTKKKLKCFVSFAHKDGDHYMEAIVKGIGSHAPEWEIFTDTKILLGEDWHKRIQAEVRKSDFAILLIGPDFFNSAYVENHEFVHFIKEHEENGFPFFGVMTKVCDYKKWDALAKHQIFIAKGKDYGFEGTRFADMNIGFDMLVDNPDKKAFVNFFCYEFVEKVKEALKSQGKL